MASGILFLEGGHWKELPFTATHKAGSNLVEAEDATVRLSLLSSAATRCVYGGGGQNC